MQCSGEVIGPSLLQQSSIGLFSWQPYPDEQSQSLWLELKSTLSCTWASFNSSVVCPQRLFPSCRVKMEGSGITPGENRYSSRTWEQEWKQWIPTSGYLESQAKSSVGMIHIQNSLYEISNKSYKSQNSGLQNKSLVRILPKLLSFGSEVHGCSRQFLSVDEGSGHKRSPFQTQTMSQTPHWEEPRCSRTSWPEYRGNGLYLLGFSRQLKPLSYYHPLTSSSVFTVFNWTYNKKQPTNQTILTSWQESFPLH